MSGAAANMEKQLMRVENELQETRQHNNKLRKQLFDEEQKRNTASNQLVKTETQVAINSIPRIGNYYALIIGVNNYQSPLVDLKTPNKDAKLVDEVLDQKYGFETILLVDGSPTLVGDSLIEPTRDGIIQALEYLRNKITDDDHLLIYFAGHGEIKSGSGHWLPQDAQSESDANWLSTNDITKKISYRENGGDINARHILVIADSCYSAAMITTWLAPPSSEQIIAAVPSELVTRSSHSSHSVSIDIPPILSLQPDNASVEERIGFIAAKQKSISRKELTSGGLEPVLDTASKNGISIFANAFTDVLKANNGIISANEIYGKIGPEVNNKSREMGKEQTPVYAPIPNTGNNHGEFFFIAR